MPKPPTDRCVSCGAEAANPINLAIKLDGLESWILLPHCRQCEDAGKEQLEAAARRIIEEKKQRLERRETGAPATRLQE